jgi:hypothetical protein
VVRSGKDHAAHPGAPLQRDARGADDAERALEPPRSRQVRPFELA